MLKYRQDLKGIARRLRARSTDSETLLWSRLRRKQLLGIQFYRQKPIGDNIVDFFAPRARLVVEVDGSQHQMAADAMKDKNRDARLTAMGLTVLRFNAREVLNETAGVVEIIYRTIVERAIVKSPRAPL